MKRFAAIALAIATVVGFVYGCGTDSSGTGTDVTGDDAGSGDDATTSGGNSCGNGVVDGNEECDNGAANAPGSGCERDCTFTCAIGVQGRGNEHCDDGNPCNGAETCAISHACTPGTPLGAGASCGTGKVCSGGTCVSTSCGDGVVEAPEECDDGNSANGDGCDTTCTFSCVSADTTRDCTPADPCAGKGTCNDATHTCAAGTPLGDGTGCGAGGDAGASDAAAGSICQSGVCTAPSCGDGVVQAQSNEDCDFGSANGPGTGCEINCKFSCTMGGGASPCVTQDICAGTSTCTTVHPGDAGAMTGQKCILGTPPAPNTPCGPGNAGTCVNNACKLPSCGNGTIETVNGEQCDFGAGNNIAGMGCEPNTCKFSCQTSPSDTCPNSNLCGASPQKCSAVTGANNTPGKKCTAATTLAACAACTSGSTTGVCVSNACKQPKCGDGCVSGPTDCEPPNTATCDATCHKIVCGDGVLEGPEQCDDSNTLNLDGCDKLCKFEQDHRANQVVMKFTPDPVVCPFDALGGAIGSNAQDTLQGSLGGGVNDGSTTIAFKFMGLTDLTGTQQDAGLALGALSGAPYASPAGKTYDGGADMDWWYVTSDASVNTDRTPVSLMTATLDKKLLNATGSLDISLILAGGAAKLHLSGASIAANVAPTTSAPLVSSDGKTPGHLPAEHDVAGLKTFPTMSGTLCGNISAASLAQVPMPATLTSGFTQCTEGYTSANHLLDALVNGCTDILNRTSIAKTNPDQVDPSQPPAGGGGNYTLVVTGKKVTGCVDKNNVAVPPAQFQACLNAAAYSSFFSFTTDRVIMK